jgi:hypothetical protein
MRTRKRISQRLYLRRKNNRWKWMAGATATAAGVTASQAGMVTINLVDNYITAGLGNHLNADVTGDGHPDLTIAHAFTSVVLYRDFTDSRGKFYNFFVGVSINGVPAFAYTNAWFGYTSVRLGLQYGRSGAFSLTGSIPIFFKDLHINGGAPTMGSVEVTVSGPDATIQLDSLTYTSNGAVPDEGGSLGLLAMGAGGVLALRRSRAAQLHL